MGELYKELVLCTTPSFSQSSKVFSMKSLCASGILNCLRYTGKLSFRLMRCLKFFAQPKSVSKKDKTDLCFHKMSLYHCLNSLGTEMLSNCSKSDLVLVWGLPQSLDRFGMVARASLMNVGPTSIMSRVIFEFNKGNSLFSSYPDFSGTRVTHWNETVAEFVQ